MLLYEGHGVKKWVSGTTYDGEWLLDMEHGKGVYTDSDGKCGVVVVYVH